MQQKQQISENTQDWPEVEVLCARGGGGRCREPIQRVEGRGPGKVGSTGCWGYTGGPHVMASCHRRATQAAGRSEISSCCSSKVRSRRWAYLNPRWGTVYVLSSLSCAGALGAPAGSSPRSGLGVLGGPVTNATRWQRPGSSVVWSRDRAYRMDESGEASGMTR